MQARPPLKWLPWARHRPCCSRGWSWSSEETSKRQSRWLTWNSRPRTWSWTNDRTSVPGTRSVLFFGFYGRKEKTVFPTWTCRTFVFSYLEPKESRFFLILFSTDVNWASSRVSMPGWILKLVRLDHRLPDSLSNEPTYFEVFSLFRAYSFLIAVLLKFKFEY